MATTRFSGWAATTYGRPQTALWVGAGLLIVPNGSPYETDKAVLAEPTRVAFVSKTRAYTYHDMDTLSRRYHVQVPDPADGFRVDLTQAIHRDNVRHSDGRSVPVNAPSTMARLRRSCVCAAANPRPNSNRMKVSAHAAVLNRCGRRFRLTTKATRSPSTRR